MGTSAGSYGIYQVEWGADSEIGTIVPFIKLFF